jgi:hypothetical protein
VLYFHISAVNVISQALNFYKCGANHIRADDCEYVRACDECLGITHEVNYQEWKHRSLWERSIETMGWVLQREQ